MDQTPAPSILRTSSEPSAKSKFNFGNWFGRNFKKILIVVLIVVIAVLGIRYFRGGFSSNSGGLSILGSNALALSEAQLGLVASSPSYRVGEKVAVDIRLFTGGNPTDSTDAVIKYDPEFLVPDEAAFASTGTLYSEYPAIQVDKEQGLIGISGITLPGSQSFNGAGSFATLYFSALKDGTTPVTIEFEKGATADSNVVLSATTQDILGTVGNAEIVISETGAQVSQDNTKSCDSFVQECIDAAGMSGTQVCTGGSMQNNTCSYDNNLTESCTSCQSQ